MAASSFYPLIFPAVTVASGFLTTKSRVEALASLRPTCPLVDVRRILQNYLVINGFFGGSSGDHSLNEVFKKNSDPVLDPMVSRE